MDERIKILLVDDEPLARRRIQSFRLPEYGFEIAGEAENGREALELLDKIEIDIVVTDIVMPVMDGLELLEQIRKRANPPEVIMLTCYDEFQKAQKAIRLGAQDYVTKMMLEESEFVGVLGKVSGIIQDKKKIYKKLIRQTLFDVFKHCLFSDGSNGLKQLVESGFNPKRYCICMLKLTGTYQTSVVEDILGFEKWHGTFRSAAVEMDASNFVFLVYSFDSSSVREFSNYVNDLCSDLCSKLDKNKNLIPAYWIISGEVCHNLSDLPSAYEQGVKLSQYTFYYEKGTFVSSKMARELKTDAVPPEWFYKMVGDIREYAEKSDGENMAGCLSEWLEHITCKYMPLPGEIKNMAFALAASIPGNIDMVADDGNHCTLSQWLKEGIEKAEHISEVRSVVHTAAERIKIGFCNEPDFIRSEIKKAIEYIRECYENDISLDQVAKHVSLSPSWFGTLFRNETGKSFWEYLTDYRIKMAQQLMTNTDLEIYRIAEKVGIRNANYFSRLFTKTIGKSPADYRSSLRKKAGSKITGA